MKSSRSIKGTHGPDFELHDARLASALNKIIQNTRFKKKVSLEEIKLTKKTVSFEEDRLLTWSSNTSGSLGPKILSIIMPIYLQSLFEMTMFRTSIRNGMKFYCRWHKFHLMTSWKDCTNEEYESLRNSRPYWNCVTWRFIRRKQDLMITDWRRW